MKYKILNMGERVDGYLEKYGIIPGQTEYHRITFVDAIITEMECNYLENEADNGSWVSERIDLDKFDLEHLFGIEVEGI